MRLVNACKALALLALSAVCPAVHAEAPAQATDPNGVEFFEKQIRPILVEKCYSCHSAEATKIKADFRLDSRVAMLKGGKSGNAAVVPGDAEKSPLIRIIRRTDAELEAMPPKSKDALSPEQVKLFEQWVQMGAPDPRAEQATVANAPKSDPKEHWAFKPVKDVTLPAVDSDQNATPIDRFILAKLKEKGLTPSKQADKRTLIRRATLDLTGLPPTPEEIEDFLKDDKPDAYERLIDRLLGSAHYGERWGRYWLDIARYADTKGYVFEEERKFPYAYTYRDWVIKALNDDMPYDQFLVRQIAADQLDEPDKSHLAAMGFLTVGRRFLNSQPDIIDDRIDVVSRGTMAMTVGCARCHDHKYDAISMKDYYGLYGVFSSSEEPKDLPLLGSAEQSEAFSKEYAKRQGAVDEFLKKTHEEMAADLRSTKGLKAYLLAAHDFETQLANTRLDERRFAFSRDLSGEILARWRAMLAKANESNDPVWAAWHLYAALDENTFAQHSTEATARLIARGHTSNPIVAWSFADQPPTSLAEVANRYAQLLARFDRTQPSTDPAAEKLRLVLQADSSPVQIAEADTQKLLRRDMRTQLRDLRKAVEQFQANSPDAPPRAMVLVDAASPANARIFLRGNANNPGEETPRRFLAVLSGGQPAPFSHGSGRLELARAITDKGNPLTARVMVNRLWLGHFGAGLVTTPSDFGVRSDPPSHPELLDYLAKRFMDQGWSIKKLHREIMLSATYRQKSDARPDAISVDPTNRLLWKMNRRRLDFESMRDSLLAVSGKLDETMGGKPVDITASARRRTIYGFIDRQNLPGMFRAFDFASPDTHSPQRFTTVVPQQALFMMNSGFVGELAQGLAARPDIADATDEQQRIDLLYETLFARPPTPEEMLDGLAFVSLESAQAASGDTLTPWAKYAHVLLETNEFVYVD